MIKWCEMKQWAHKQSGFTIVELLIVIVVIAILAAITIVSYNGITGRAQESGTASHLKDLIKKVELFKVENGSYPPSIASITGAKDDDVYSLAWNTYCVASGTSAKQYYMMSDTQKVNKGSCDVRIKPSLPFAPEACFGFDSAIQSITFWYAYENNNSANAKCPTEFSVPSQIGGVPVQHIGRGSGPGFSNAQVDAVVLPETLVSIYGSAFERSSIKYVYLPDSMTTMCCGGFGGTSLSSIFIPEIGRAHV